MTDRVKAFTVILDHDIRIDDIEYVQNALRVIQGVTKVEPIIADGSEFITEGKVKMEIADKLYKFIKENL